jgi:hypothetical protein
VIGIVSGPPVEYVQLLLSLAVSDLKFCLTTIGPCYIGICGSKSDRHGSTNERASWKGSLVVFPGKPK